jgi:hypothetical protein
VDLVLLIDAGGMEPERLRRDIQVTFQRRKTHAMPEDLAEPPGFWTPVFAKLAAECAIDPDIRAQYLKVRDYLRQANILG